MNIDEVCVHKIFEADEKAEFNYHFTVGFIQDDNWEVNFLITDKTFDTMEKTRAWFENFRELILEAPSK